MIDNQLGPAVFAGYLIRLVFKDYRPELFRHYLRGSLFEVAVATGAVQSTILNFSAEKYSSLLVPYVELARQAGVVDRLNSSERSIEDLGAKIGQSVALLAERKRALITAAVTGEFNVSTAGPRAAAAVTG